MQSWKDRKQARSADGDSQSQILFNQPRAEYNRAEHKKQSTCVYHMDKAAWWPVALWKFFLKVS